MNVLTTIGCVLAAAMLGGCAFQMGPISAVVGSGKSRAEARKLPAFLRIEVGNAIQVEFTQGPAKPAEVSADDNVLPLVKTEVSQGTLKIGTKGSVTTHNPIRVRLWNPDLVGVDLSGASRFSSPAVNTTRLAAQVSGASTVRIGSLTAKQLEVTLSGASSASIEGKASKAVVSASGASRFEGLTIEDAKLAASGASHVKTHVTQTIDASASGASSIKYSGSPKVLSSQSTGASSIGRP